MKKAYTICYMVTGGVTIEAESEDEAINRFYSGEFDEEIGRSLAENEITVTETYEEDCWDS